MLAERLVELADETDWLQGGLLTVAVRHGRREVAQLLLDAGWDVDESTRLQGIERGAYSSGCPLWKAADNQDYGIVEMLLDRGADANALVYASGNALSRAYNRRDERMKELLRRYGAEADPETLGLFRDTAGARKFLESDRDEREIGRLLWTSACGGDVETVRLCLPRLSWPPTDMEWFRILEQPFRMWGHSPVVRYPDGDRKAYHECFRVILEHGADPNVEGRFNSRLLHFLMAAGSSRGKVIMTEPERLRFAQILVEFGAALDPRDDLLKSTPLGWACRWGRREVVEFLLGVGASPRESEAEPWARPLAWAEKRGHLDVARILRKAGATGKA